MNKITAIIGDVHGCLEELDELLKQISYNPEEIRLVFLGDIIERGPDSIGCLKRIQELKAECVIGNHEDKLLRYCKHEGTRWMTGKENPMKVNDEIKYLQQNLTPTDLFWIKSLPSKIQIAHNLWAVHAGLKPNVSFDKQEYSHLLHIRYITPEGKPKSLNPDKTQPEGTIYWTEQWKGPESIIYGHAVHDNPRWDSGINNGNMFYCLGIDTGCCFGGSLTCVLYDPMSEVKVVMTSVKAKKIYYLREKIDD